LFIESCKNKDIYFIIVLIKTFENDFIQTAVDEHYNTGLHYLFKNPYIKNPYIKNIINLHNIENKKGISPYDIACDRFEKLVSDTTIIFYNKMYLTC
jgi:hypothetical protein